MNRINEPDYKLLLQRAVTREQIISGLGFTGTAAPTAGEIRARAEQLIHEVLLSNPVGVLREELLDRLSHADKLFAQGASAAEVPSQVVSNDSGAMPYSFERDSPIPMSHAATPASPTTPSTNAGGSGQFCSMCGNVLTHEDNFCRRCGAPIALLTPPPLRPTASYQPIPIPLAPSPQADVSYAAPIAQATPLSPPQPKRQDGIGTLQEGGVAVITAGPVEPQKVKASWETTFSLIEKAGGAKLTDAKSLNWREQHKVMFNIWSLVFGVFYYLWLGLWKPFLAYTILFLGVDAIVESVVSLPNIVVSTAAGAICSVRVNGLYYDKIKNGNHRWL